MRRTRSRNFLPLDPEIKKTIKRNLRAGRVVRNLQPELERMAAPNNQPNKGHIPLCTFAVPKIQNAMSSIRNPAVEANNFEIKPALIQMVQNNQFLGAPKEDPNLHLSTFLEICATFKYNRVSEEAIMLRLFSFSLKDGARRWLNSLPLGSVDTWDSLAQKFLTKYFPPSKTTKLRTEIVNFNQFDRESLYDAWERFKELLRKCPHHGMQDWLVMQVFYGGLSPNTKTVVDAAAGGAFLNKD
ncbi:hypothetical protein L6164_008545 [Bauhinia variegata]|uniref:Uncharacterized protein n=1 Tax=Bauhinia variegata TaxID=167791 RepID=A0ACB9PI78_BAUVA|nr:hypothetical protein L6164_008545 [Bauhinia variegata]